MEELFKEEFAHLAVCFFQNLPEITFEVTSLSPLKNQRGIGGAWSTISRFSSNMQSPVQMYLENVKIILGLLTTLTEAKKKKYFRVTFWTRQRELFFPFNPTLQFQVKTVIAKREI